MSTYTNVITLNTLFGECHFCTNVLSVQEKIFARRHFCTSWKFCMATLLHGVTFSQVKNFFFITTNPKHNLYPRSIILLFVLFFYIYILFFRFFVDNFIWYIFFLLLLLLLSPNLYTRSVILFIYFYNFFSFFYLFF